jgi:hypothetical protein
MDNAFKLLRVMIVLIMIDDQRLIIIQIVRRIRLFNSAFSYLHDVYSCKSVVQRNLQPVLLFRGLPSRLNRQPPA